jgi:hypothetical protein
MPRPSHSSRFDHPNNIGWAVQIIKLLIMHSPPPPCSLVPLGPKHLPQRPCCIPTHQVSLVLYRYLVSCLYLCTVNLALCHAPVWLLASTLDAQDKVSTHDLCVRSTVTRPFIYPVTLFILVHFCCKLHAVTFAYGARDVRLHPSMTIKRLGTLLLWAFRH